MPPNPKEQKNQKTPIAVLRELCNLLVSTGGLVSAKIEFALSRQGAERESVFRQALDLSNRGLWAVESMDFMLSRLEQQLIRKPSGEADPAIKTLTAPIDQAHFKKSAGE